MKNARAGSAELSGANISRKCYEFLRFSLLCLLSASKLCSIHLLACGTTEGEPQGTRGKQKKTIQKHNSSIQKKRRFVLKNWIANSRFCIVFKWKAKKSLFFRAVKIMGSMCFTIPIFKYCCFRTRKRNTPSFWVHFHAKTSTILTFWYKKFNNIVVFEPENVTLHCFRFLSLPKPQPY